MKIGDLVLYQPDLGVKAACPIRQPGDAGILIYVSRAMFEGQDSVGRVLFAKSNSGASVVMLSELKKVNV